MPIGCPSDQYITFRGALATALSGVVITCAMRVDTNSQVMSRSFLVESLLMTDDVTRASSSSSPYSHCTSVSHLATPYYNQLKLTESTSRNKPLSAAMIQCRVLVGSECAQQCTQYYNRLALFDSRSCALLNRSVHYLQSPLQLVDVQLQRLTASSVHTSLMCSSGSGVAVTTSGRQPHHCNNESTQTTQSLKLAAINYTYQAAHSHADHRHIQQQQQQQQSNDVDMHHNSCTAVSTSTPSPVSHLDNDDDEFHRQTGQPTASCLSGIY